MTEATRKSLETPHHLALSAFAMAKQDSTLLEVAVVTNHWLEGIADRIVLAAFARR